MHNLCSGTQYTLGSTGAQAVISPGKQEHPAPSLPTVSTQPPQTLGCRRRPTACRNTTAIYAYILGTPLSLWLLASSQGTNSSIDTLHPSYSPSLATCSKGVVPNNDSRLPATPCSFFFFSILRKPKTHRNPKDSLKQNKTLRAGSFCFPWHINSRGTVVM